MYCIDRSFRLSPDLLHPDDTARYGRSTRPQKFLGGPAGLRKRGYDQVVGIAEQIVHHLVRQRAIQRDGVPVPLVQVVAGGDGRVTGPKLNRQIRIALETDLQRLAVKVGRGEHLPADLEYRHFVAEREVLDRSGKCQAIRLELMPIHPTYLLAALFRHKPYPVRPSQFMITETIRSAESSHRIARPNYRDHEIAAGVARSGTELVTLSG